MAIVTRPIYPGDHVEITQWPERGPGAAIHSGEQAAYQRAMNENRPYHPRTIEVLYSQLEGSRAGRRRLRDIERHAHEYVNPPTSHRIAVRSETGHPTIDELRQAPLDRLGLRKCGNCHIWFNHINERLKRCNYCINLSSSQNREALLETTAPMANTLTSRE